MSKGAKFAGFWFEAIFLEHHKHYPPTQLAVKFVPVCKKDQLLDTKFSISSVTRLDTKPPDTLSNGILYEFRSQHPIVDCVGYLQNETKTKWLVFIQVSLQAYRDHQNMVDFFHKPPSARHVPKEIKETPNLSLYTFYRKLCNLENDNTTKVMMLYVSPREANIKAPASLLPELQEGIKKLTHVKQQMHVGILSEKSSFYEVKEEF